jgi:hypothetical protein
MLLRRGKKSTPGPRGPGNGDPANFTTHAPAGILCTPPPHPTPPPAWIKLCSKSSTRIQICLRHCPISLCPEVGVTGNHGVTGFGVTGIGIAGIGCLRCACGVGRPVCAVPYIYIYIYIYIYACIYVCKLYVNYIHIIYTHAYTNTRTHAHANAHACICCGLLHPGYIDHI